MRYPSWYNNLVVHEFGVFGLNVKKTIGLNGSSSIKYVITSTIPYDEWWEWYSSKSYYISMVAVGSSILNHSKSDAEQCRYETFFFKSAAVILCIPFFVWYGSKMLTDLWKAGRFQARVKKTTPQQVPEIFNCFKQLKFSVVGRIKRCEILYTVI